jgi:TetR/AcrR family transcriptional regulator
MKSRQNGQRRDPSRTREAILGAAQDEFARKGLSGCQIDEIARRSRVNKRMIYHYLTASRAFTRCDRARL